MRAQLFCRVISLPKYKNASYDKSNLQYRGYKFRILRLIILSESLPRLWLPHEFEALHVAGCQGVWLKGSHFKFQYFITASQCKSRLVYHIQSSITVTGALFQCCVSLLRWTGQSLIHHAKAHSSKVKSLNAFALKKRLEYVSFRPASAVMNLMVK